MASLRLDPTTESKHTHHTKERQRSFTPKLISETCTTLCNHILSQSLASKPFSAAMLIKMSLNDVTAYISMKWLNSNMPVQASCTVKNELGMYTDKGTNEYTFTYK